MFGIILSEIILLIILAVVVYILLRTFKKHEKTILQKDAVIESLRVVNHDFKNKMHVLMGYIETDRWDIAKEYINNIQTVPSAEIVEISRMIKIQALSALIIGKIIEAKELGIQLCVMPDSICDELTYGITVNEYITVIGNLVQNAIEELEEHGDDDRCIDLYINTSKDCSVISVVDNGNGLTKDEQEDIFTAGYTTKVGNNRGVGLTEVNKIAVKRGGKVDVESEPGEGTEFYITMYAATRR